MKQCPKCGATYTDADLRTMCSTCLVEMVRVKDAPAEMAQPGPVSVGPVTSLEPMALPPLPEITVPPPITTPDILEPPPPPQLPDVTMPDIAPVEFTTVEAPPVAVPPPAPALEAEPLPVPDPLNEAAGPLPEADIDDTVPAAPEAPPPVIVPEINRAIPPLEMTPPPVREPDARPSPPPLTMAPPVVKRTPPPVVDAGSNPRLLQVTVGNPLPEDLIAGGRSRSGVMRVFAIILWVVSFLTFTNLAQNPALFFLLAAFVAGAVAATRASLYQGAIDTVVVEPKADTLLGALLPIDITIAVLRELSVTNAHLTITARERVIKKDGDSSTTYTHTLFTHTSQMGAPMQWPGGATMRLAAQVPIPAEAIPSFAGATNHIEWTAALWVSIPGWYPDIRKTMPMLVRPLRAGAPPITARYISLDVPALRGLSARLSVENAATPDGTLLLPIGQSVPVTLTVIPEKTAARPLRVELAYHISGTGTHEDRVVAGSTFFVNGAKPGVTNEETRAITIPATAPISYDGRYLRVRWTLTIAEDTFAASAQRQTFPVIVVPGQAEGT